MDVRPVTGSRIGQREEVTAVGRWLQDQGRCRVRLTRALAAQDGGVTTVTTTLNVAQFLDEWLEAQPSND